MGKFKDFSSKEHVKQGYNEAEQCLRNISKKLQTKSGKRLFEEILNSALYEWWKEVNR